MTEQIPPPPPGFQMVPAPPPGFQIQEPSLEHQMDKRRGAPARVRFAVGAAVAPEDRLSTLKRYYPDAKPFGDDNFVFTDPKTKRPTLYNPEGMDFGDVTSIAPEIAEYGGGTMGAAVGSAAGPLGTAGGAGLGAAGGRELVQSLAKATVGTQDTRPLAQRFIDPSVTAGVNAVGGRLGELAMQGAKGLSSPVFTFLRNRFTGATTQELARSARDLGVNLSAGTATQSKGLQTIEKGIEALPGGADTMQEAAERALRQLQESFEHTVAGFGQARSKQGAGEVLREGSKAAATRFAARRETLDQALEQAIGPQTRVTLSAVTRLRNELATELASAPESRSRALQPTIDRLNNLLTDARNGGGIDFGTLRQIRTDLGRELDRPDISGYSPSADAALRRAYGAIREDITTTAKVAGPQAQQALQRHDRYVRFNRNVNLPALQKVADQGSDEAAFNYAMSAAKDGGSRLTQLRRSLNPAEWDVVASSMLSRMGRATEGQQGATGDLFSPSTFLTNWNKLAPEARQALFGGTRYATLAPELTNLARVSAAMKNAEKTSNFSNTARTVYAAFGLYDIGTELLSGDIYGAGERTALYMIAPRAAAKLMTSPRFVRWLAQLPSAGGQGTIGNHLGRLAAIAKAEPEIKEDVQQYLDALRQAPDPASATSPGASAPR